jgi:hypothetical protein
MSRAPASPPEAGGNFRARRRRKMNAPYMIVAVAPTGTKRSQGIACGWKGCVPGEWDEPTYPDRPEAKELRAARQAAGLSLRQAGAILGSAPRDLNELEHGRSAFVDAAGWRWAIDALTKSVGSQKPPPASPARDRVRS